MLEQTITTKLGKISITIDNKDTDIPIVFMHGAFLDKTLWADYDSNFTGKTHIYIDMPAHGNSSNVGKDWSLDDCVEMLISILDELNIQQCIAIGQSWGAMTALRAASKYPSRFSALGLFNMPFKAASGLERLQFNFYKLIARFRRFYAGQAAKSLYSPEILSQRPELSLGMQNRLAKRPPQEIARMIDAVILNAEDGTQLLEELEVPALAILGESDSISKPPKIETRIVPGVHITPHESVTETKKAIKRVMELALS